MTQGYICNIAKGAVRGLTPTLLTSKLFVNEETVHDVTYNYDWLDAAF
jgi:hypothetical protein